MITVRALRPDERDWADSVETSSWGERRVVRRGEMIDPAELPALVAELDGERAGLLAYAIRGDECEAVTVRSLIEGRGVARAMLEELHRIAVESGCRRLWLVTTNDSLRALDLYQRWGMDLCAFRRGAVNEARRIKPAIPERNPVSRIPIAHEFELELLLP